MLDEWRIEGAEVHAMTRSADGRIWVGDASTNEISVVELAWPPRDARARERFSCPDTPPHALDAEEHDQ